MKNYNETLVSFMLNQLTYLQGCFNIMHEEQTFTQKSVTHVQEFVKFTANELLKIKSDMQELEGKE